VVVQLAYFFSLNHHPGAPRHPSWPGGAIRFLPYLAGTKRRVSLQRVENFFVERFNHWYDVLNVEFLFDACAAVFGDIGALRFGCGQ